MYQKLQRGIRAMGYTLLPVLAFAAAAASAADWPQFHGPTAITNRRMRGC